MWGSLGSDDGFLGWLAAGRMQRKCISMNQEISIMPKACTRVRG